jgi:hypothetical protein
MIQLDRGPSPELLRELLSMGRASHQGNSLRVELESLEDLLPMLRAVSGFDGRILDFRTVENNLEDIFLDMIREGSDENP